MSWIHHSFNAWSPHWMFVEPPNWGPDFEIDTQKNADGYFADLGYDTTLTKDRRNLYRPTIVDKEQVEEDIHRYRTNIRDNVNRVRELLKDKEGVWLDIFQDTIKREEHDKFRDTILLPAWAKAAKMLDAERQGFPVGMSPDFVWLRDQFRTPLANPVPTDIKLFPKISMTGYRETFTRRLTYRPNAFGEAAPNDAVLLAPHINEALGDPSVYMQFLFSRALTDPSEFWRHDFNRTYIGRSTRSISGKFLSRHVMNFDGQILMTEKVADTQYGHLEVLGKPGRGSFNYLCSGDRLSVDEGLRLLRVQEFIYAFLRQSFEELNKIARAKSFARFQSKCSEPALDNELVLKRLFDMASNDKKDTVCRAFSNPLGEDQQSTTWEILWDEIKRIANFRTETLMKLRRYPQEWWKRAEMFEEQNFGYVGEEGHPDETLDRMIDRQRDKKNAMALQMQPRLSAMQELVINSVERAMYWDHLANFCHGWDPKAPPPQEGNNSVLPKQEEKWDHDYDWEQLYIRSRLILHEMLEDVSQFRFQGAKNFRGFFLRRMPPLQQDRKLANLSDPHSTNTEVFLNKDDEADHPDKLVEEGGRRTSPSVRVSTNSYERPEVLDWEWRRKVARLIQLMSNPISLDHVGMRSLADALGEVLTNEPSDVRLLDNQREFMEEAQVLSRICAYLEELKPWPYIAHHEKKWTKTLDGGDEIGRLRSALHRVRRGIREVIPDTLGHRLDGGIAELYRNRDTRDDKLSQEVRDAINYSPMKDPSLLEEENPPGNQNPGNQNEDVNMQGNALDIQNEDAEMQEIGEMQENVPDNQNDDAEMEDDDATAIAGDAPGEEDYEEPLYARDFSAETHEKTVRSEDRLRKFWQAADEIIRRGMDSATKGLIQPEDRTKAYYLEHFKGEAPNRATDPFSNLMYRIDTDYIAESCPWTNLWNSGYDKAWHKLMADPITAEGNRGMPLLRRAGNQTYYPRRDHVEDRAVPLSHKAFEVANIIWNIDQRRHQGATFTDTAFLQFLGEVGFDTCTTRGTTISVQLKTSNDHRLVERVPKANDKNRPFSRKVLNFHMEHTADIHIKKYGHWAKDKFREVGIGKQWLRNAEPKEKTGYTAIKD